MKILSVINLVTTYMYLTSLFSTKPHANVQTAPISAPMYKKLIFVLLDGMRIDGAVRTSKSGFYFNKLSNLYTAKGYRALSFCSNPTLTSIRIKSMVHGTPSCFLEGLSAFSHIQAKTPNFFDSIRDKSVLFFGDETWTDLFGLKGMTYNAYGKVFPMEKEIEYMHAFAKAVNTADVLIGHFSALDSYGHVLTIDHHKIEYILGLFNGLIKDVYDSMGEDTLFVVTSDHGVTDSGDHGGSSIKERSSFVYFIDKRSGGETMSVTHHDKAFDWIKGLDGFDVVNQEDIFPTICALMGFAIPFNSFGKLISALVNDPYVYAAYSFQKMKKLGIHTRKLETEIKKLVSGASSGKRHFLRRFYSTLDRVLTEKMHEEFCGINKSLVYTSIALTFLSCILLLSAVDADISICLLVLCIVMVSHSVYSFIHEDLIWTAMFLFRNCGLNNLLACTASYFIGRYPQHAEDRWIWGKKISPRLNGYPWFVVFAFLCIFMRHLLLADSSPKCEIRKKTSDLRKRFAVGVSLVQSVCKRLSCVAEETTAFCERASKLAQELLFAALFSEKQRKKDTLSGYSIQCIYTKKVVRYVTATLMRRVRSSFHSACREILESPHIIFLVLKYLLPSCFRGPVNLDFLMQHPSPDTLLAMVLTPPSAFFMIYLLPVLTYNSISSHYSLVQLMFFASGLNYDLSSISTEIPHVFSDSFSILSMVILVAFYLLYVKLKVLRMSREYIAMATFHVLVVQITTYVTHNEMVYFFFFVGRCFFVMLYFVLENILYLLN